MNISRRQFIAGSSALAVSSMVPWPRRAFAAVKAFPSAEGFGASETTHARSASASVLHVTNLLDSGSGSLRAALTASGPRYIVFDVSGDITLSSFIEVNNGNFYLAGQTSPNGVQVRGFDTNITLRGTNCHNAVIRHLRIRPGGGGESNGQAFIVYGANGEVTRVIVDHCSIEWYADAVQFYQPHTNCIFQWCLFGEGSSSITPGGKGMHLGKSTGNESVHHCIMAHFGTRVPLGQQSGITDFRNNIIYNWGGSTRTEFGTTGDADAFKGNVVKNLWIPGNDTQYPGDGLLWLENGANTPCGTPDRGGTKIYLLDNEVGGVGGFTWGNSIIRNGDPYRCGTGPDTTATQAEFGASQFTAPAVTEYSVAVLKATLLASIGACRIQNAAVQSGNFAGGLVRDSADQKIVNDVNNGTGNLLSGNSGTYPTLSGGSVPTDSDKDGVPDYYCILRGLNPNGNVALTFAPNGYQWIENYLNELAGDDIGLSSPPSVPSDLIIRNIASGRQPAMNRTQANRM